MILVRSPLRITLGGGGTDLPSYYLRRPGFAVAACINRHVYVALTPSLEPGIVVRSEVVDRVQRARDLSHPIVREVLLMLCPDRTSLELSLFSDIPGGTGLGSSGSLCTALVQAICALTGRAVDARDRAELACRIEIETLGRPVGKQDPYAASFGGLQAFTFAEQVGVEPVRVSEALRDELASRLSLFFTGITRPASAVLMEQNAKTLAADQETLENLDRVRASGEQSRAAIEAGDWPALACLMNEQWELKRTRSAIATNARIEALYEHARDHGALAGKLVGAGGGGFLMFLAEDPLRLRRAMQQRGLEPLDFSFEPEGTKVLVS